MCCEHDAAHRTTAINRATRTVTTTTDLPASDLDAVEITIDGLPVSSTTPTVATATGYGHDALGRLETITSPRGIVTSTVYHPVTGRVSSSTHAGKTTHYTYHPAGAAGAGMVATETRPDNTVIRTAHTARGEVFRVWGGGTYPLEYTYNSHGQIETLKTFRSDSGWTAPTWPASPGTADTTTWTYHPESGRLHQKTDAANQSETLTWHEDGKLHTRQRATGKTATHTWTNLGQPESITYSDSTPAVHHTYDRAGRVKTTTDAAGTRTFTHPDLLTTTETITGGILAGVTRTATKDTHFRPSQLTAASGTAQHAVTYQYTTNSRLGQVVTGAHTATYGYLTDSDLITTITFKSGATTRLATARHHDSSDRPASVTHTHGTQAQTFGVTEFDDMHRRKKIEREDGTRWAYDYNSKGEVTSGLREKTASPNPSVPGWQHGYTFDEIGNRLTATTNSRVSTYTPNNLNQYDNRTIPRAFDIIGKADAAATVTVDGNPATRLDEFFYKERAAGSGPVHTPYLVQATDANGTTTRSGGKFLPATPENFAHDLDGNLTSDGRFTYTWDAENRLIAMETHATVPLPARRKLAFAYDSIGRRIRKTVWQGTPTGGWQLRHHFDFIHEPNGWNILAERSSSPQHPTTNSQLIRTYTWGTDLSGTLTGAGGVGGLLFATLHTSGKTFAYESDLNGNVTLLVDTATGQPAATYDYGPFGEPLRQSGEYATLNPYRFSTKHTDEETGLLDYGLRYYNPSTGRWLSRDPIAEDGGVNLYGFLTNNGITEIDVLGMVVFAKLSYQFQIPSERSRIAYQIDEFFEYKICTECPENGSLAAANERDVARAIEAVGSSIQGFAHEKTNYDALDRKHYRGTLRIWTKYIGNLRGTCKQEYLETIDANARKYNVIFIHSDKYSKRAEVNGVLQNRLDITAGDPSSALQHELGHMIGYGHPHPDGHTHETIERYQNDIMRQSGIHNGIVFTSGNSSHPDFMHGVWTHLHNGSGYNAYRHNLVDGNVVVKK
jgi:RHS repeat-associated protein